MDETKEENYNQKRKSMKGRQTLHFRKCWNKEKKHIYKSEGVMCVHVFYDSQKKKLVQN